MNSASVFRYIPALDGMRALAVLSVVLYHADVAFVPGGFLGVELFFVVSGYLITSLLWHEHNETGQTDWLAFWKRRAKRLFPALWSVLLLVPAYAAWRLPEELYGMRDDVLAALLYVTNWQLIAADQSYFEQVGRPSLLQHLWSLAVEEQFYLLWPLVFSLLLAKVSRRSAILGLLCTAAASVSWMGVLYEPGADPSRVYYGSDTRAFGLLLGAALACALPAFKISRNPRRDSGLGALALAALALSFVGLDELEARVYPAGLLGIGLATCGLIASCVRAPTGWPNRLLSAPPLVAIGKRSYSLYLWHWPVVAVTRPGVDQDLSGAGLLLLRLLLTAALAELSYRCVETPLRQRAWLTRAALEKRTQPRWELGAIALAALILIPFSGHALIAAQQPLMQDLTLAAPQGDTLHAATAPIPTLGPNAAPPLSIAQISLPHVLAIGDSVMLGARKYLRSADAQIEVDAEVGRTPLTTLALLKKRKAHGLMADVVIVHLGNNGPFQPEHFDRMMELLSDVPHVAFVTAKVPRRLGVLNNRTIREGVARHTRAVLIDWYEASKDHADWFREDGLHLREGGATQYALLLARHYLPSAGRSPPSGGRATTR